MNDSKKTRRALGTILGLIGLLFGFSSNLQAGPPSKYRRAKPRTAQRRPMQRTAQQTKQRQTQRTTPRQTSRRPVATTPARTANAEDPEPLKAASTAAPQRSSVSAVPKPSDRQARTESIEADRWVNGPIANELLSTQPMEIDPKRLWELIAEIDKRPTPLTFNDPRVPNEVIRSDHDGKLLRNRFLNSNDYVLQSDGSIKRRHWTIKRVADRNDAAELSQVTVQWTPWRQSKPEIRARVITPEGQIFDLLPEQIVEQAAGAGEDDVFTDGRQCVAVLSGVQPGCLIEFAWSRVDKPTLAGVGCGRTDFLGDLEPYRLFNLRITSEPSAKWLLARLGPTLPIEVAKANEDHEGTVSYRASDTPSLLDWYESKFGTDDASIPMVRFAHNRSWDELGKAYHSAVDQTINEGRQLITTLTAGKPWTKAARAAGVSQLDQQLKWAVETIAARTRYTGWSLGDKAIVPATPDQTIMRRFGDCKDQSTLLVALLKDMGVTAHVALLETGESLDTVPNLPTLSNFDHAIVAVENPAAASGVTFVDPTVHCGERSGETYPVDLLGQRSQHRWALVCSDKPRLVRTPAETIRENHRIRTRTFVSNHLGGGYATILETWVGSDAYGFPDPTDTEERLRLRRHWNEHIEKEIGLPLATGRSTRPSASVLARTTPSPTSAIPMASMEVTTTQDQLFTRAATRLDCHVSVVDQISQDPMLEFFLPVADKDEQEKETWEQRPDGVSPDAIVVQTRRLSHRNHFARKLSLRSVIRIPSAMTAVFEDQELKQQIGLLRVHVRKRRVIASQLDDLVDQRSANWIRWKEPQPGTELAITPKPDDQCFVLDATFEHHAGSMTAAEIHKARDSMSQWCKDGWFMLELSPYWEAAEDAMEATSVLEIAKLLKESDSGSAASLETLAVATSAINSQQLGPIAQTLVDRRDLITKTKQADAATRYTLACSLLERSREGRRTTLNSEEIKPLLQDESTLAIPDARSGWLLARMMNGNDHLKLDAKSAREAFDKIARLQPDLLEGIFAPEPNLSLFVMVALMAGREDQLIRLAQRQKDFPVEALDRLVRAKTDPAHDDIDPELRQAIVQRRFNALIATGRFDLARRFQANHRLTLNEACYLGTGAPAPLPKMNGKEAESVLRHFIAADVLGDETKVRRLLTPTATHYILNPHERLVSPNDWGCDYEFFNTEVLAHHIAAKCVIEMLQPSPNICYATMRYGVHKTAYVLCRNTGEDWSLLPAAAIESIVDPLRSLVRSGNSDEAASILDEVMRPLVHRINHFNQSDSPGYAVAWKLLSPNYLGASSQRSALPIESANSKRDQQIDWTIRLMAAVKSSPTMTITLLLASPQDVDLGANPEQLDEIPDPIRSHVESALIGAYKNLGRYDQVVAILNQRAIKTGKVEDLCALLDSVHLMSLTMDERQQKTDWRTTMRSITRQNSSPRTHYLVGIHRAIIERRYDQAIREIRRDRSESMSVLSKIVLPQNLLALAVAHYPEPDVLQSIIDDYGTEIQGTYRPEALYWLASAHLILGNPDEAIKIYSKTAAADPDAASSQIFYGLISQQLGLDDVAETLYSRAIKQDLGSKNAIAAARLIQTIQTRTASTDDHQPMR